MFSDNSDIIHQFTARQSRTKQQSHDDDNVEGETSGTGGSNGTLRGLQEKMKQQNHDDDDDDDQQDEGETSGTGGSNGTLRVPHYQEKVCATCYQKFIDARGQPIIVIVVNALRNFIYTIHMIVVSLQLRFQSYSAITLLDPQWQSSYLQICIMILIGWDLLYVLHFQSKSIQLSFLTIWKLKFPRLEASIVSNCPDLTVVKCGLCLVHQHDEEEFKQTTRHGLASLSDNWGLIPRLTAHSRKRNKQNLSMLKEKGKHVLE